MFNSGIEDSGALTKYEASRGAMGQGYTSNVMALSIQASLGNSIYGQSSTVQPPSIRLMPCIKI